MLDPSDSLFYERPLYVHVKYNCKAYCSVQCSKNSFTKLLIDPILYALFNIIKSHLTDSFEVNYLWC